MIVSFKNSAKSTSSQFSQYFIPKHDRITNFDQRISIDISKILILLNSSFPKIKYFIYFSLFLLERSQHNRFLSFFSGKQIPRILLHTLTLIPIYLIITCHIAFPHLAHPLPSILFLPRKLRFLLIHRMHTYIFRFQSFINGIEISNIIIEPWFFCRKYCTF